MTEEKKTVVTFAQLSKLITNDLTTNSQKSALTTKYTYDMVLRFLDNPVTSQKQLRQLSRYLYNTSSNYKRLVDYFSSMLRFDYVVEPYDLDLEKIKIDTFKKQYNTILKQLETMNLPHELSRVLTTSFKEDVFYGYEHQTDESYFIQKIDPDFCQISSIEDGVFNYSFDFSYFDAHKSSLRKYPQEFIEKYAVYLKDRSNNRWQEIDSKKSICFKINEDVEYPYPPFSNLFESLFDIDETKKQRKVKNKMDNYMILTQKIPIKSDEADAFLINMDTAMDFHNLAMNALPDEVGLVTSPMEIEAIKLERKNTDVDTVAQAERDFYNAAGVSQFLFNSDKASASGLAKSIITDEQIVFRCLQQFERWINRKLKQISKTYKFKIKFLETTRNNYKDVQDSLLKAAQYGMPVKMALASTYGLSPSSMVNMTFLENEILDLPKKLIPLSSSHTQSGDTSNGAPTVSDEEISESGEQTRENEGNVRE